MLAMHYAIDLEPADLDSVRKRIAAIGPAFDKVPGLVAKAFLLRTEPACYSLYYLWQDAEAATGFLEGPRFAAVCDKYGRPEVTLYLASGPRMPFASGERIAVGGPPGSAFTGIDLHDPRTGSITSLTRSDDGAFELLYLAGPNGGDVSTTPPQ